MTLNPSEREFLLQLHKDNLSRLESLSEEIEAVKSELAGLIVTEQTEHTRFYGWLIALTCSLTPGLSLMVLHLLG